MERLLCVLVVLVLAGVAFPAQADAVDVGLPRIALVTTGINAAHPAFAPGQVVAWRDFGSNAATPFDSDEFGYGTRMASVLAAKPGLGACRTESVFPGAPLIVAAIMPNGSFHDAAVEAGIVWAADRSPDVIVVSITEPFHVPDPTSDAIAYARSRGALVIAGAFQYQNVVGPAWLGDWGNDPLAISVGYTPESGRVNYQTTADPDVATLGERACTANPTGAGYGRSSGAHISAARLSGLALLAQREARAAGAPASADAIFDLLLASANNHEDVLYATEGLGRLDLADAPAVLAHARAGTRPDYVAQGEHAERDLLYRETVVAAGRAAQGAPTPPAPATWSGGAGGPSTTRIAIIDTGIQPDHPEFAPGQVVAWRDLAAGTLAPMDSAGHGTATASVAAGLNAFDCGAGIQKMSFAPGAPLIIAKVHDDGLEYAAVQAAIPWAVQNGARVLSMSLGGVVPELGAMPELAAARDAGVLVFVSAGNVPASASWLHEFGNTPGIVVVGGGPRDGRTELSTTSDNDPDVASWSDDVCVAEGRLSYGAQTGTSFATPLVAGMAAKAIEIAESAGMPSDAGHIKAILLGCATNRIESPYAREGLGFLLDGEWACIERHAREGTLPDYAAQGPHAAVDLLYHETVMDPEV